MKYELLSQQTTYKIRIDHDDSGLRDADDAEVDLYIRQHFYNGFNIMVSSISWTQNFIDVVFVEEYFK